MSPRRSLSVSMASERTTREKPAPKKDWTQNKSRSQKSKKSMKKKQLKVDTDEGEEGDILDVIGSSSKDKNNGLQELEEDLDADTYSAHPSRKPVTSKKPKAPQGLCLTCRMLYQRAKRAKAPIKSKLLDHDPMSLTCDQWVLIKKRESTQDVSPPPGGRKRLSRVPLDEVSVKRRERLAGARPPSGCKRPLIYLNRNLRLCLTIQPSKKSTKTNKKRRRGNSQDSRVAKQQRLQSSNSSSIVNADCWEENSNSCFSSCLEFSGRDTNNWGDAVPPPDEIPSTSKSGPTAPRGVWVQQRPKKGQSFQGLLAKMRGNSSTIVKETH